MTVTREQIQEALEEIRRVPLRNYEIIRIVLQSALDGMDADLTHSENVLKKSENVDTSEALDALKVLTDNLNEYVNDGDWPEYEIIRIEDAVRIVRAALTRPSVGWKPIESAPRDGTEIYVTTTDEKFVFDGECFLHEDAFSVLPSLIVQWGRSDLYQEREGNAWCMYYWPQDGEYNSYPYVKNPTHWMPLPAAPKEGEV